MVCGPQQLAEATIRRAETLRMQRPHSRVALVTGGSAGLGRVMTLALLEAGHRVVAVGRTPQLLDELTAAARELGAHERLLTARGRR